MAVSSPPLGAGSATASRRFAGAAPWRHLDLGLIGSLVSIEIIGAAMVYFSTRTKLASQGLAPTFYVKRQAVFLAIGAVIIVLTALVDYRRWRDMAPFLYAGMCFLLILVVSPFGSKSKGHQAWFQLGSSFQLQPSEISKVILILCLAAFASWSSRTGDREETLHISKLVTLIVMAGVPMALIMLQPDLGTDMCFAAIMFAVLVVAGARGRHLAALLALAVVGVAAILNLGLLKQYQVDRLTAFLDPAGDTRTVGYNLNESKIAIGSGSFFGKGLGQGSQTNLSYVPEQHTDFIFTAVGEQLGFAGSALLLMLFGLLVWRTWRTAMLARDRAGTLICVGVLALIVFQVFENVGMTMGIMPIAGIPLPFVSYGGSAILAYSVAMGLVLNVHMRRFS